MEGEAGAGNRGGEDAIISGYDDSGNDIRLKPQERWCQIRKNLNFIREGEYLL